MTIIDTLGAAVTSATGTTTKQISALLFNINDTMANVAKIKINIQIVRSGGNIDVTNGSVAFLPFLAAALKGRSASSTPTSKFVALVPLTPDGGAFKFQPNDLIKIDLVGLTSAAAISVDGIESSSTTNRIFVYEIKPVAASEVNFDINTVVYDSVSFTDSASLSEINMHENGATTKYSYRELFGLMLAIRPLANFGNAYADSYTSFPGVISLPLNSVQGMNIVKDNQSVLNFYFRMVKSF